jgi:hypothetical protein
MYSGKIDKTWNDEDYINLSWYTNEDHEERFNATVNTETYNVGVAICNENLPQVFYDLLDNFNIKKPVVAVNKLSPGKILPYHKDKFVAYKKRNNVSDEEQIVRYIVFLHDSKAGHQLWIEDNICVGPVGSFFGWDKDTIHMAANLGWEDRYILQITGVKDG